MPYSLRRLFATLLVHCCPTNPRDLWERFEDPMSEDFKILLDLQAKQIQHNVLSHINEILHSMGHNINEYKLISEIMRTSREAKEAKEVHFERTITVSEADILLEKKLNVEQRRAYNVIIARIFSNKGGAFFIDGPGGTGKTFLYRALLATVRSKGFIALATTSSGVAASILPGGRTAHSRFKIPIDIDQNYSCNISKQSSLAYLIRDAKLIVWDEVSMVKSKMIEVFDLLLKNIMGTHELFGGKVVVFGGDFRQTLPVVRNGKKEDFIRESLLYCNIWNRLEKLKLSENMRAKTDPAFCKYLMRIGNGTEKVNCLTKLKF
ncbi:PREDICTED: ATP-dependent DNA helicase PIF7-like [Nicotiana attenuata]|uniref:ATP-dependent DNA helicase PIF7-like n=1 Tax=Nicotiana attenuata TaxID=49451 RepID=UPI000904AD62|nr:PREDICTED: ATP-dependent DNA helicase PIF7-like [Nicotiana attenuata]